MIVGPAPWLLSVCSLLLAQPVAIDPAVAAEAPAPVYVSVATTKVFFFVVGFGLSLPIILYAIRRRREAASLLKAIAAGGVSSGIVASIATQLSALPGKPTLAEAFVLTTIWFVVGIVFWSVACAFLFWLAVYRPCRLRLGGVQGVRSLVAFWSGVEPLSEWSQTIAGNWEANKDWDEFACALEEVSRDLQKAAEYAGPSALVLSALGPANQDDRRRAAIAVIHEAIDNHIEKLCARLARTTLNFSIWRVDESGDCLEHLVSLPIEHGHEAGHGHKGALPVWDKRKSHTASLASTAMKQRTYRWMNEGSIERHWDRRNLGKYYDEVAAMPVPCDGDGEAPWAVVCVERRDGIVPLSSHSVRVVVGALARLVATTKSSVAVRDIDGNVFTPGQDEASYQPAFSNLTRSAVPIAETGMKDAANTHLDPSTVEIVKEDFSANPKRSNSVHSHPPSDSHP